ncbi:uncharacterized protein LOC120125689 [Hibiscus syriacus]|uniref:uncharacterized protein LOC120125689 n=1 Tax=Hibiscus syriacus TaxID=106335 RepID=UPI00192151E3|nr:uncharacterized protein LOC120125689 [Hibiscus syriacus]
MNCGPCTFPVAPPQTVSNRPASVYKRYADEMPRDRSGTMTYLLNPKASMREHHSANSRRGKHNYNRNGHHSDKEGNRNAHSKSRAAGAAKVITRMENQCSSLTNWELLLVKVQLREALWLT